MQQCLQALLLTYLKSMLGQVVTNVMVKVIDIKRVAGDPVENALKEWEIFLCVRNVLILDIN